MSLPWYHPIGDEMDLFEAAWSERLPVLLQGPTGCGKTRFIEHMAARVQPRHHPGPGVALVTVACHDDLTANDLVGRHLLLNEQTVWTDGPLTRAARGGAICYLDELAEARRDTTVVVHSLTDHRRLLPIEKTGELLQAHPDFLLVASTNPGYQAAFKALKPSTRQRFVEITFGYPPPAQEAAIVAHEAGIEPAWAQALAQVGERLRAMQDGGLGDHVSTRALVHAGQLMRRGIPPRRACAVVLAGVFGDEPDAGAAALDVVDLVFP
ncbi:AAA family ATPase [Comamonas serinivorans]|uniref:AAA family ATPase n=1 Tax=Comamonas serinivorans TaxID=1082851 RepID=A0A1Y0EK90_9BURK|nr:CbbQ/NirQ/NorQ/GpvN family protein [Comamonas serinivorans]ARU03702.1 AAA family ATPase [Comamonas serinivorans]